MHVIVQVYNSFQVQLYQGYKDAMPNTSRADNNYIVQVGENADYRLGVLNNIFRPTTMSFLTKLGLKRGMQVLEVGCGTGQVTIDLAKAVGPTGHVTAVDISPEQISVARKNIHKAGLNSNVTLRIMNANDLRDLGEQFHLVCSRFILMHLEDPDRALAAMWASVIPGGILACEEPEMSRCSSETPSDAFNRSMNWHMAYATYAGLDFNIGKQLLPTFKKLGFSNPSEWCAQPFVEGTQPEKDIYPLLHDECKPKYVAAGLATAQQVDDTVNELRALVANPKSRFGCAMQHQVWSRKSLENSICVPESQNNLRSKL
jgi:ubiquinone/menaquinone biosynthesis C-methylase UbiE